MNAGTKYLMDSIAGLVIEVANLRTVNEAQAAEIAAFKSEKGQPDIPPSTTISTATFDEHGQATP